MFKEVYEKVFDYFVINLRFVSVIFNQGPETVTGQFFSHCPVLRAGWGL